MTNKEAREYLLPIWENAQLHNYAAALGLAIKALEDVEKIGSASSAGEHSALVRQLRSTVSVSKREMLDQAAAAIEQLSKAVAEEHERFVRYADYSVQRDKMIEQLKKDLLQADETGGCLFCLHALEPMPCEAEPEADYICNECPHEECCCGSCRGSKNWEWRGIVENNRVKSDTDKLVEIDQFAEVEHG